jgi:hypothetical protein
MPGAKWALSGSAKTTSARSSRSFTARFSLQPSAFSLLHIFPRVDDLAGQRAGGDGHG